MKTMLTRCASALAYGLIWLASRLLPRGPRERYRDEWGAELDEIGREGLPTLVPALRILARGPAVGFAVRRRLVDDPRSLAMVGVLASTAGVAAVSAAFALESALQLSVIAAGIIGIGWGGVILNLDRVLVLGMTRQSAWSRNLLAALPRVALAALLGAVVSTPIVLRIFQPEIDAQIPLLLLQKKATAEQRIADDPRYVQIPELKQQIDAEFRSGGPSARSTALTSQLQALLVEQAADMSRAETTFASGHGLLIQIEALDAIGNDRPEIARAQLLLFMMFLSLEILPVLMRLLQMSGEPPQHGVVSEA